jgi:hypothetical protein
MKMKKILFFTLFFLILPNASFSDVSVIEGLTRQSPARPGERYEGTILLKNKGDSPSESKIFKRDYLFYADGRNIFGEPGIHPRSNAGWLSISPSRVTIYPGETVSIHYKVQVPDSPDLKGTYWSVVIVEPISETSPESIMSEKGKAQMGIRTVIRHAIQIVSNIGNTGTSRIRFLDKRLISDNGRRILEIDIENTGERWLSPSVWVELFNEQGRSIGKFEGTKFRIYPGCSVRQRIDLTDVPKGRYKTLIVADNEDENIFGTRLDLGVE